MHPDIHELDLIEGGANLLPSHRRVPQEVDERLDRLLEVDVVVPEGVVAIDQQELAARIGCHRFKPTARVAPRFRCGRVAPAGRRGVMKGWQARRGERGTVQKPVLPGRRPSGGRSWPNAPWSPKPRGTRPSLPRPRPRRMSFAPPWSRP